MPIQQATKRRFEEISNPIADNNESLLPSQKKRKTTTVSSLNPPKLPQKTVKAPTVPKTFNLSKTNNTKKIEIPENHSPFGKSFMQKFLEIKNDTPSRFKTIPKATEKKIVNTTKKNTINNENKTTKPTQSTKENKTKNLKKPQLKKSVSSSGISGIPFVWKKKPLLDISNCQKHKLVPSPTVEKSLPPKSVPIEVKSNKEAEKKQNICVEDRLSEQIIENDLQKKEISA